MVIPSVRLITVTASHRMRSSCLDKFSFFISITFGIDFFRISLKGFQFPGQSFQGYQGICDAVEQDDIFFLHSVHLLSDGMIARCRVRNLSEKGGCYDILERTVTA